MMSPAPVIDCNAPDAPLPHVERPSLVQIHCHHHGVIKPQSEQRVLERLGIDYELLPSGCCGMAGSFGFESEKYPVSMTAAERVLLPRGARGAFGYASPRDSAAANRSSKRPDEARRTSPSSSLKLADGQYNVLDRTAAAHAMIGVADHPGRSIANAPRNDPVRQLEAMGDERGARGRRLPR